MKKLFLSFFILLSLLTLDSCKSKSSGGPTIEGEWVDCNGEEEPISITKQGDVLMLHSKSIDIAVEKKTNELYIGNGGMVTLSYDIKQGHWYLSGVGSEKFELCRRSEVS